MAGTATDYRLRFFFRTLPVTQLVAFGGALFVMPPEECRRWGQNVYSYAEVRELFPGMAELAAGAWAEEEIPLLVWRTLSAQGEGWSVARMRRPVLPTGVATAFFGGLEMFLKERPPQRWLGTGPEAELAAYCVGLAFFEDLFRAGPMIRSPLLYPAPAGTAEEILARARPWVDDVSQLARAFYADQGQGLLGAGSVVLGPTFAGSSDVGGADADLVADGCLVEFKTTIQPSRKLTNTLRQLLGYVLLDYDDRLRLNAVGICFVRQRRLVTLELERLLREGSGGRFGARALPNLRDGFRRAAKEA